MTDAPEAKPENMVTNVTMTVYGVKSDAPEAKPEPPMKTCNYNPHGWKCRKLGEFKVIETDTGKEFYVCPEHIQGYRNLNERYGREYFVIVELPRAVTEAKPEPRCAACGREKSSNRHDVRPDWYHAFVTEPASQPGEFPESALSEASNLPEWEWWFSHTSEQRKEMVAQLHRMHTAQPGEFNNYDVRPFSPLPEQQAKHVEHWLKSNEKSPADVKWSLYPIGMVQRWIERALEAEVAAYRLGGKP